MQVTQPAKYQKKKISHSKYFDQKKLNTLTKVITDNIASIYDYFNTPYYNGEKLLCSRCFVHGGDNKSALNFYYNADYRVHFKCRTHACEDNFGTSVISLIRGGLSHSIYNWSSPGDKEASFKETILFLLQHFSLDWDNIQTTDIVAANKDFNYCQTLEDLNFKKPDEKVFDRDFYVNSVDIPAEYFIKRGYTKAILNKYDVGT